MSRSAPPNDAATCAYEVPEELIEMARRLQRSTVRPPRPMLPIEVRRAPLESSVVARAPELEFDAELEFDVELELPAPPAPLAASVRSESPELAPRPSGGRVALHWFLVSVVAYLMLYVGSRFMLE